MRRTGGTQSGWPPSRTRSLGVPRPRVIRVNAVFERTSGMNTAHRGREVGARQARPINVREPDDNDVRTMQVRFGRCAFLSCLAGVSPLISTGESCQPGCYSRLHSVGRKRRGRCASFVLVAERVIEQHDPPHVSGTEPLVGAEGTLDLAHGVPSLKLGPGCRRRGICLSGFAQHANEANRGSKARLGLTAHDTGHCRGARATALGEKTNGHAARAQLHPEPVAK